jgi:glycosyltransferase involved in cell wall biosynthesis
LTVTQPDVSVVIPCFDGERTLAAAIESALVQPGVATEVIVVDDGSRDASLAVARRYEPRVRVLTGPNRGVSAARNAGAEEARGAWIVFLDADDLLAESTLARRLGLTGAAAEGVQVIACDWREIDDDARGFAGPVRALDFAALAEDAERAIAAGAWAPTAALAYRRDLVARIGGFRADLPVIQDARYFFEAARAGAGIAHAPHVGASYRIVAESLSRRDPGRFWRDVLLNGTQIEAHWTEAGALTDARRRVLAGVYDNAARALLAAADSGYFEASAGRRRLGVPATLHARVTGPVARLFGLAAARRVAALARAALP